MYAEFRCFNRALLTGKCIRITSQECPFGQNLHINSLHNLVFLIYMQIGMIFSFFPKGAALLELY